MKIKDITGQRFGRLVAKSWRRKDRKTLWQCDCDCGRKTEVVLGQITEGKTKSCGCLRAEKAAQRVKTHGLYATPEYRAFRNALNRCNREADPRFYRYGERGILFKFSSFEEFIDELGRRPTKLHSLDRINNDGHYERGNVRWATKQEQRNNQSRSTAQTIVTVEAI